MRWGFLGVVVVSAFSVLVWGWRVQRVVVDGSTIVPNAAIRDSALTLLTERRWVVIPRTSMVLGGMRWLEERLRSQFALEVVDVDRKRDGSLQISVVEQGVAAVGIDRGGSGVFIAPSGQVLGIAPAQFLEELTDPGDRARTTIVIEFADLLPGVGERALSGDVLAFLRDIWRELDSVGGPLRPIQFLEQPGSMGSFVLQTANDATVTIAISEDRSYQLTKLRAVLADRSDSSVRAHIRSIDLRYGDRVYLQE